MDLLPIQPVELGVNGGMKYCSNWVEIQWIYSQFDQSNSTGRIGSKWGHEILLKLG